MAVLVQLEGLNGSQVRVEDGAGWDVTDDQRLVVVGAAENVGPPQRTIVGSEVQPTREPVLAEFAAGTWLYVRVSEARPGR